MNTEKVEEKKAASVPAPILDVGDNQLMVPGDSKELRYYLQKIGSGGGFPSIFDSDEKKLAAYNLARALLGDRWQLALNHMAFIEGKLSIYGELPGDAVMRTGQLQNKKVWLIDKDYKEISVANKNLDIEPWGAVMEIQRRGHDKNTFHFTVEDARKLGKYPEANKGKPWAKAIGTMLLRRVQSFGYKFTFPEAFVGVPIAEYDFDVAPDLENLKEVGPGAAAAKFNAKFSNIVDIQPQQNEKV